jgi:hypothetical protein
VGLKGSLIERKGSYTGQYYSRYAVPLFFVTLVALGFAPPVLIAFSIPDILFTTWTVMALRSTSESVSFSH